MCNKISTIIDVLDIKNDKRPLLIQLNDIIREYLSRTDIDNRLDIRIYQHSLRVMKYAEKLLRKEKADKEVVLASIMLHDIGKTITEQRHDIVSFSLAKEILTKLEVDESKKNKILDCVLIHSSKSINCLDLNIEQKIVMDADMLDEIGILSVVKYCVARGTRNIDLCSILKGLETKYEIIERESTLIKTNYGKELYNKKKKNLREIIEEFRMEIDMYKL